MVCKVSSWSSSSFCWRSDERRSSSRRDERSALDDSASAYSASTLWTSTARWRTAVRARRWSFSALSDAMAMTGSSSSTPDSWRTDESLAFSAVSDSICITKNAWRMSIAAWISLICSRSSTLSSRSSRISSRSSSSVVATDAYDAFSPGDRGACRIRRGLVPTGSPARDAVSDASKSSLACVTSISRSFSDAMVTRDDASSASTRNRSSALSSRMARSSARNRSSDMESICASDNDLSVVVFLAVVVVVVVVAEVELDDAANVSNDWSIEASSGW